MRTFLFAVTFFVSIFSANNPFAKESREDGSQKIEISVEKLKNSQRGALPPLTKGAVFYECGKLEYKPSLTIDKFDFSTYVIVDSEQTRIETNSLYSLQTSLGLAPIGESQGEWYHTTKIYCTYIVHNYEDASKQGSAFMVYKKHLNPTMNCRFTWRGNGGFECMPRPTKSGSDR